MTFPICMVIIEELVTFGHHFQSVIPKGEIHLLEQSTDFIRDTVAENLKRLRKDLGFSMDQLAEAAGVSKSLIGQIERGETSPSISNLWKISIGLQIPFTLLLEKQTAETILVNKTDFVSLDSEDNHFHLYPLFPAKAGQDFEILLLELEPGGQNESLPHAPGTMEYIIVTGGTLEVQVGEEVYQVQAGGGILFAADKPHAYRNRSSGPIQATNVIHYRKI